MKSPTVRPSRSRNLFSRTGLESLEPRCLLSAASAQIEIIEQSSHLIPGTTGITIKGTNQNDRITITDNGSEAAGNISITSSDGRQYVSTGDVSGIQVLPGKRGDQVTYNLAGNLQSQHYEYLIVGGYTRGGPVQLAVNINGSILPGSDLVVVGQPDAKKATTMSVTDRGAIDGVLQTGIESFSLSGLLQPKLTLPKLNSGKANLSFESTATIGSTGSLDVGFDGSSHSDVGSVSYMGTNNGEIGVTELGNGGNDQLDADIDMDTGSTGNVGTSTDPSLIEGTGKDKLSFTVERGSDSTTTTNIFAELIGTSKKDDLVHTGNVVAKTKGTVSLVQ